MGDMRLNKVHVHNSNLHYMLYAFSLTTLHTLSSDLPLMRFFFLSPRQNISSLHTDSETVSKLKFSRNFTVILFCFFFLTRAKFFMSAR